jgi:hypothetical protein
VQEGWRYDQSPRTEIGTTIRLHLIEKWTQEELQKTVDYYVRDVEVKIYVGKGATSPQKKEYFINSELDFEKTEIMEKVRDISEFKCIKELQSDELKVRIYKKTFKKFEYYYFEPLVLFLNQGFRVALIRTSELPHFSHSSAAITVIDFKKDVVDLFISRDNIRKDTEKYSNFIDKWNNILISLYENEILEKIKSQPTEQQNDPINILEVTSNAMENYGLGNFIGEYYVGTDLEKLELRGIKEFVEKKFKILTIENGVLKASSIEQLRNGEQEQIFVYHSHSFSESYSKNEIKYVLDNFAIFPSRSIIVFDKNEVFRVIKSLKDLLVKAGLKEQSISQINIQLLIMKMNFSIEKTELDDLLPKNSHFTTMPNCFRSLVACTSPFDIELTESGKEILRKIVNSRYSGGGFFTFVPEFLGKIAETNRNNVMSIFLNQNLIFSKSTYNYFKIKENATLIFDKGDPFIGLLLQNIENIKADSILEIMAKNYFSILASYFLFPRTGLIDSIELRENELIQLLKCENKLRPINKRAGSLVSIILDWSTSFEFPLSAFPYVRVSGAKGLPKVDEELMLEAFGPTDFVTEV